MTFQKLTVILKTIIFILCDEKSKWQVKLFAFKQQFSELKIFLNYIKKSFILHK